MENVNSRLRKVLAPALLAGLTLVLALVAVKDARAAVINVSNTAQLEAAILSAQDGDQIVLAGSFDNYTPAKSLDVTTSITISGPATSPGAIIAGTALTTASTISGYLDLLVVQAGKEVTIENISLTLGSNDSALNVFGTATVSHMEVSGNNGFGVYVQQGGVLGVTNSTISDNTSEGVVVDGTADFLNTTIASNGGAGIANGLGTVSLRNTIVSYNNLGACVQAVTTNVASLDDDGTCGVSVTGDPLLARLAPNGGPNLTRALGPGSPAIDAGSNDVCPAVDQRYAARPRTADDPCDIGAFEVESGPSNGPPVLTLPADITAEATDSSGAVVNYSVSATDPDGDPVTIVCTPSAGSTFPLGPTTVTCTATATGGEDTGSFTVTVVDTTGPVFANVPADITDSTTDPQGKVVTFVDPSASDAVDGDRPVSCAPASGSTFPVGQTTVTCTASDTRGNQTQASFTVTITLSSEPPSSPSEQIVELLEDIRSSGIAFSAKVVLSRYLKQALSALDEPSKAVHALSAGHASGEAKACKKIAQFLAALERLARNPRMHISPELEAAWRTAAEAIQRSIGCTREVERR